MSTQLTKIQRKTPTSFSLQLDPFSIFPNTEAVWKVSLGVTSSSVTEVSSSVPLWLYLYTRSFPQSDRGFLRTPLWLASNGLHKNLAQVHGCSRNICFINTDLIVPPESSFAQPLLANCVPDLESQHRDTLFSSILRQNARQPFRFSIYI